MALKDFMIKSNAQMAGHITVGGYLAGPSNLVIDPAGVGDDTGTVEIKGSLKVNGTTTTVNSATLDVADLNITVAKGAANAGAADGAGLTVDGAGATLTYDSTNDRWAINKDLSGNIVGNVTGNITGTVSDISNHDTDSLSEGTTNLYYTDARFDTRLSAKSTSDLSEGTNLYYTDARVDTHLNQSNPTSGYVLSWNGSDYAWLAQSSGIADLVDDTSPQLGGDLESNGFNIEMADNNKIALGTGERGKLEHTGASGKLLLFSTTGGIDIRTYDNDEVIAISSDDGSGGIANYIIADGSTGATELYHYGSKKIATTSTGVAVTGSTTSETLISTIATGTAPLTVTSTTMVSNLNADKLDDKEFTDIIAEATALAIALG